MSPGSNPSPGVTKFNHCALAVDSDTSQKVERTLQVEVNEFELVSLHFFYGQYVYHHALNDEIRTRVSSLVARRAYNPAVVGSNPAPCNQIQSIALAVDMRLISSVGRAQPAAAEVTSSNLVCRSN